jgi:hypothetical protein
MRYLKLIALICVLLSSAAVAKEEYVPDYFPAPLGAEWYYKLTSSAGMTMDIKNVVSQRTDASEVGYNIVIDSFVPQKSISYYLKKPGWAMILKTEMPASNYTADYVEDLPHLMNPLKTGATWDYKGKMGGQDMTQSWKVIGAEKVTVPAGEFNAIKVESTSTISGSTTEYTFWYVDRVGAVRVLTKVAGMTNDMVLVKYAFPK